MLYADTWPRLFGLGWPVSATLLVRITMRTVDILVVGAVVGAAGVAAVGIGDAVARLVLFTGLGLGAGTIATVSQHVGAGRHDEADAAVTQTALLAVAVGVPFAVAGWWLAPIAYPGLGASPEVAELGVTYLQVVILSAPARTLAIMLTRAFQGAGDTRTPLFIRGGGTLVNIALTVLLVPGLAGLPEMGSSVRPSARWWATGCRPWCWSWRSCVDGVDCTCAGVPCGGPTPCARSCRSGGRRSSSATCSPSGRCR